MSAANNEDDLESLFDQISEQTLSRLNQPASTPAENVSADNSESGEAPEVFQRVGLLTRQLHDALRELGYDKGVETALSTLPDARDRLAYIARLTGEAADKALSAVERGQALQEAVHKEAAMLAERWDQLFAGQLGVEEFKEVAKQTRDCLHTMVGHSQQTNELFTEVMMAQDFHDLTGQVIQKVVKVAQRLEEQLVQLLLDTTPPERRTQVKDEWLSGPVISADGRDDVVVNQKQVDDLLGSLGF